jgi:hypothetical protein
MTTFASLMRHAWDSVLLPLCKLNRIQFDAPWAARPDAC